MNPAAGFLLNIGFTANAITLLGLVGHLFAAVLISSGRITWAGFVILLFAPLDALDGAMARLAGKPSQFGAFFDSVVDRYSELVLFAGLLVYYQQQSDLLGSILVYASIAGSIMVSYARARAEALGFDARIGILSRLERYLILVPVLIFNIPKVGLWILAILTNLTAVQRILYVKKQSLQKNRPA